jgi:signal transduction histidine kinase
VRLLSSLRSRVFVATAAVAALALLLALGLVTSRAVGEAEAELRRDLERASEGLSQQQAARQETLRTIARLLADLPKLKAAVDTGDPATVRPIAQDYRQRAKGALLFVCDRRGRLLDSVPEAPPRPPAVAAALAGEETVAFEADARGLLQLVTVPILLEPDVLGALGLGFRLDDAEARRFKARSDSEVAVVHQGRVRATTLSRAHDAALAEAAHQEGVRTIRLGDADWLALARPLEAASGTPVVVLLRSRSERLAFLSTLREALLLAALLATLLAVVLSWGVARSVTRPLSSLTRAMREMAKTGDLTPRLPVPGRLDDEDASLVARSFGSLAAALERFQREAALRDRLSALGRLSTVIAHEVRNPLMTIKASVATLRRSAPLPGEAREAADDIDHEVARLNRIVGDVLDFARPVRVEYARADVNALVREVAEAALGAVPLSFELLPGALEIQTDPDRLRAALLNVVQNAREAVAETDAGEAPLVSLRTLARDGRAVLVVADRGPGIAPDQLAQIFEPYFTTKRSGTGLGLAIAKNVVDALHGTIEAHPREGGGTEIVIELPLTAPGPR